MPRELTRQEFDAIATRIAQSAPAGLSRQEFDDLVASEAMKASGYEAPLTRERQASGAPSALEAGHHPETLMQRTEMFGQRIPTLQEIGPDDVPSDAAFLKRGPEVGGAAGMVLGGPVGAGLGAAAGSLAKGQHAQGAHVPTGKDVGRAATEGGLSALLAGAPLAIAGAARAAGPALANNAGRISRAIRGATGAGPLAGIGAGFATGNPIVGAATAAATRAVTSPAAIKTVGNLAGRAGAAVPTHTANKAGFGLLSADAFRKALLDALAEEQP